MESEKALVTYEQVEEYVLEGERPSDAQKESLYLLINGISGLFESQIQRPIIKQGFVEVFDGGFRTYLLDYFPAEDLTVEVDDEVLDSDRVDLYPEEGRVELSVTPRRARRNVRMTYTAGFGEQERDEDGNLIEVDVGVEWQMQALKAINHQFNKDLAHFARVAEGAVVYPSALPPGVQNFLKSKRRAL